MFWSGYHAPVGVRHPGLACTDRLASDFLNVGRCLTHGALASMSQCSFLAVAETQCNQTGRCQPDHDNTDHFRDHKRFHAHHHANLFTKLFLFRAHLVAFFLNQSHRSFACLFFAGSRTLLGSAVECLKLWTFQTNFCSKAWYDVPPMWRDDVLGDLGGRP